MGRCPSKNLTVYGAVDAPGWVAPVGGIAVIATALLPVLLAPGEEAFNRQRACSLTQKDLIILRTPPACGCTLNISFSLRCDRGGRGQGEEHLWQKVSCTAGSIGRHTCPRAAKLFGISMVCGSHYPLLFVFSHCLHLAATIRTPHGRVLHTSAWRGCTMSQLSALCLGESRRPLRSECGTKFAPARYT